MRDLFGSEAALVGWARYLRADRPVDELVPDNFVPGSAELLIGHLRHAGVARDGGALDSYRLAGFQQVIALLPFFRLAEQARRPPERRKVVFTVPAQVTLPRGAEHIGRSLVTRLFDALVSATDRTLLLSPYWSQAGAATLWDPLGHSVGAGLPIALAGARPKAPDDQRDHDDLAAMLVLGRRLRDAGATVRALRFVPPRTYSILHAKVVAGAVGYLGSANLTASGLGEHVEVGLPATSSRSGG